MNQRISNIISRVLKEETSPTVGCIEGVCKNGKGKYVKKISDKLGTFVDTLMGDFGSNEGKLDGEGTKITKGVYNARVGSVEETNEGTFSNGQLVDGTRETKTSKNYTLEVGKFVNSKLEGQATATSIREGSEVIVKGEFKAGNLIKGKVKYEFDGFAINVESDNIRGSVDYTFTRPIITTPKGKKYTGYMLDVYGKNMVLTKEEGGHIKDFVKFLLDKENEPTDIVQKESISKKIIRLKETDLTRIVKRVINFNNKK
jgi:hypothetical protein